VIHDDSAAFCERAVGLKCNDAEGGLFEKGDEREGHSAILILSASFPRKISKSGGLEGYIADYKVDYISQSSSTARSVSSSGVAAFFPQVWRSDRR
jgi:hypothetical protein